MTIDRNGNPSDVELAAFLQRVRRVVIVGLSDKPDRESYQVAKYLIDHGYEVIPVNPAVTQVLGRKAYGSLAEVPGPLEVVDVFRKSEATGPIVQEAIRLKAAGVWLQLGVTNDEAIEQARSAGLFAVQDRCIKQQHQRLIG